MYFYLNSIYDDDASLRLAVFLREAQYLRLQVLAVVDEPGHGPVRGLRHVDPVPAQVHRRLHARRRPREPTHPPPVKVVLAAAAAAVAAGLARARHVEAQRGGVVEEREEGVAPPGRDARSSATSQRYRAIASTCSPRVREVG